MKQGSSKDWTDAVREKALSGGSAPSPASWEVVGRRVRRGTALRRAALSAAVVLPLLALLVWAPWKTPAVPTTPVAQVTSPVPQVAPPIIPDPTGEPIVPSVPSSNPVSREDKPAQTQPPSSKPALNEEDRSRPEIPNQIGEDRGMAQDDTRADADDNGKVGEDEQQVPRGGQEPIVWPENPGTASRPRVAIGLRAGAGTARRTADIALQSAPYIAALTYLNTREPAVAPGVKSNYANSRPYVLAANSLYPDAVSSYTHDLPLSLGLSVRLDLTPRLAVESGLEYTYLHSVEESVAGRLDQRLHFIGIPLRMETTLWTWDRLGFYAGIGGKVEKCVSASLGTVLCEESRLQWSAETFGGIQYRLGGRAHLYFQPELSYYFTRTDLITYRTEHPLGLSLHAGLRFDL